jgi:hypothetical protein
VKFSIDSERRLVRVKFGQKVTASEIGQYAESLRADPAFEPTFSEIADLRAANELDLNAEDFLKLADQVDPFSVSAKRAFVVQTLVQKHAARMHRILRTQRNIEIFQSSEEAERWINS